MHDSCKAIGRIIRHETAHGEHAISRTLTISDALDARLGASTHLHGMTSIAQLLEARQAREDEWLRLDVGRTWDVVICAGAAGARACQFSAVPFVEMRGVTDGANSSDAADFRANLKTAMGNVTTLIITWLRERDG
jgi:hypothetical protein